MRDRSSLLTCDERDFLLQVITEIEGIGADLDRFVETAKKLLRFVPDFETTAETLVYRTALELWSRYRGVGVIKH